MGVRFLLDLVSQRHVYISTLPVLCGYRFILLLLIITLFARLVDLGYAIDQPRRKTLDSPLRDASSLATVGM
jgi:hypothetical protein